MFNQPNPFKEEDVIVNLKIIAKSAIIFISLLFITVFIYFILKIKFDISSYFISISIPVILAISYFIIIKLVLNKESK